MCWKIEYALLIFLSTIVDYWVGLKMGKCETKKVRKKYLLLSLFINLGILGIFKYYNFFADSFQVFFASFNILIDLPAFELLLPVGISFYTFQTLSYSIDVYNGNTQPERNFAQFALYVSFFPQLVAGPIERSNRLLPQLREKVTFNEKAMSSGFRLILWGFFKKLLIADRLAILVNEVYGQPEEFGGFTLVIATIFFAFQIYCDFSGYSDIAIGTSRMFGIDLMTNFRSPYFSKSISEFWKRWHISLSTWFRDYVYIPLGGNRSIKWRWYYNLFITFLLSGLWHGANSTFVLWGAFHGILLILGIQMKNILGDAINIRSVKFIGLPVTFALVCFSWILFRANSLDDLQVILSTIFSSNWNIDSAVIQQIFSTAYDFYLSIALIVFLILIELTEQRGLTIFDRIGRQSKVLRWSIYLFTAWAIIYKGVFQNQEFIYFQF